MIGGLKLTALLFTGLQTHIQAENQDTGMILLKGSREIPWINRRKSQQDVAARYSREDVGTRDRLQTHSGGYVFRLSL